jgi:hypothetical protein
MTAGIFGKTLLLSKPMAKASGVRNKAAAAPKIMRTHSPIGSGRYSTTPSMSNKTKKALMNNKTPNRTYIINVNTHKVSIIDFKAPFIPIFLINLSLQEGNVISVFSGQFLIVSFLLFPILPIYSECF